MCVCMFVCAMACNDAEEERGEGLLDSSFTEQDMCHASGSAWAMPFVQFERERARLCECVC